MQIDLHWWKRDALCVGVTRVLRRYFFSGVRINCHDIQHLIDNKYCIIPQLFFQTTISTDAWDIH